jgi:hypothetical protein
MGVRMKRGDRNTPFKKFPEEFLELASGLASVFLRLSLAE